MVDPNPGLFIYNGSGPPIFDQNGNVVIPPTDSQLLTNIRTDQEIRHKIYVEEQKAKAARDLQLQNQATNNRLARNEKLLANKHATFAAKGKMPSGQRNMAPKWQSARDFVGYGVEAAEWNKNLGGGLGQPGIRPGSYLDNSATGWGSMINARGQIYTPQSLARSQAEKAERAGIRSIAWGKTPISSKLPIPEWSPEIAIQGQGVGTIFGEKGQGFRERAKQRIAEKLMAAKEKTELKAIKESAPKAKEPTKRKASTKR